MTQYTDIALPIAQQPFTFAVPETLQGTVREGCAVCVPLGSRLAGGIVVRLHNQTPPYKKIRNIESVLFDRPVISRIGLRFWQWIAEYYMCTLGEVVFTALPSLIRPKGRSADEFSNTAFTPPVETFVRSTDVCPSARAKRQTEVFRTLKQSEIDGEVTRRALLDAGFSASVIKALVDSGAAEIYTRTATAETLKNTFALPTLTTAQTTAADALREEFKKHQTTLLQGVSGCGKTEVMATLAAEQLAAGHDVLWLVPELSLSAQFSERLEKMFGQSVTIYNSSLTARRRAEIFWKMSAERGARLTVGLRSALFLPYRNLGLVIVDEEYDSSYKQQDPAPRYGGRDTAVSLAALSHAPCILSAATPSVESYANALSGKYGYVKLTERYGEAPAPEIIISDTRRNAKRGERHDGINKELYDALHETLAAGGQAIIFQNRRGTAPYVECECGWRPRCPKCGIVLTLHGSKLLCHYCGRKFDLPEKCPQCGSDKIEPKGAGTQRVYEVLREMFPTARIARLDRDTAGSAQRTSALLDDFAAGRTDILVGTQLVTKGLDFDGVSLVGITSADNLFTALDFRATERAFDMLMQAAGRAGRRGIRGKVVIQTAEPENTFIRFAANLDYDSAAAAILEERKQFDYPPYNRIISLNFKGRHADMVHSAAEYGSQLLTEAGFAVFGPQSADTPCQGISREVIMLKIKRSVRLSEVRTSLSSIIDAVRSRYRQVTVAPNVDSQ